MLVEPLIQYLGFFSFMLLLLNLYFQRKQIDKTEEQLELSREELKLTRDELKKAADAQVDSAKLIDYQLTLQRKQRFDNFFFNLFDQITVNQNELINLLSDERYKGWHSFDLEALRNAIKEDIKLTRYFRLIWQTLDLIHKTKDGLDEYDFKNYIKLISSQQDNIVSELLFIHISSELDKETQFQSYLKNYNFFKYLWNDDKKFIFKQILDAYEACHLKDKFLFFEN